MKSKLFLCAIAVMSAAPMSFGADVIRRSSSPGIAISTINPRTIDEDTSTGLISFSVSSQTGNITRISGTSSNTNLVPNANISITFQDPTWQLLITPATNQFGKTTITISVNDSSSRTGQTSFDLTVNPVEDPTTVRLVNPSEGQLFLAPANIDLVAEASNPDGRVAQVEFIRSSAAGAVSLDTRTSFPYAYTWSGVIEGDYTLTAVATDDRGIHTLSPPVNVQVRGSLVSALRQVDVVEGDVNAKRTVQIPIRGLPQLGEETITYWTSDGTAEDALQGFAAIGGIDYLPISATHVTLNANTLSTTLPIEILGDLLDERNKLFYINWSSPNPSFLVSTQLVVNIIDDDPLPLVSINDVQVGEGSGEAVFTLTMSAQSLRAATVQFVTESGTAIGGKDFVSTTNHVTIPKGFFSTSLRVPILNGELDEPNETFFVNLTQAENVAIGKGRGQAVILDDDPGPVLSVANVHVAEGDGQTTQAVFAVALSFPTGFPVSVNYATVNGTALAGQDYVATSGTLIFEPGQTNQSIGVVILGDTIREGDESFLVTLTLSGGSPAGKREATATIRNDDPPPRISISDVSILEGNSGTTNIIFRVILSSPSGLPVSLGYGTANGTATIGSDFVSVSGTVVIEPGGTVRLVSVPILGDTVSEPDEIFILQVFGVENAVIERNQAIGTILNDDAPPPPVNTAPTIGKIGDQFIAEGKASAPVAFTVGDVETPAADLTLGSSSSALDLIASENILFAGTGANRSVTYVPSGGKSGTATITLIVFDSGGLSASTSFKVTVGADSGIPSVNWPTPSDIKYGISLDARQLNATVNVPGVSVLYDPPLGTVLNAGSNQNLSVTFKRADGSIAATMTVTINVLKALLTISANDQSRSFGVANPELTVAYTGFVAGDRTSNLTKQASVSTKANETNPAGIYPIEVSGAVAENYDIRFVPGVLTVTRAIPSIIWESPVPIVSGVPLGDDQLNARSNVPGAFSYDPPERTVLQIGDSQKLTAFFVPDDRQNYEPVLTTVSIDVKSGEPATLATVKGDFNSDGFADLIFQDSSGSIAGWMMKGETLERASLLNPRAVSDVRYKIAGSGDFNQDGVEDLLFQHDDGSMAVWFLKGLDLVSATQLDPANPGDLAWKIVATGDFNSDGKTDLVFQNTDRSLAVWLMNGTKLDSAALFSPSDPGVGWHVVGTGDFNSDGENDLIFQHEDGTLAVWNLKGTVLVSANLFLPANPGKSWRVRSVADRNEDGKPDLIFQHAETGDLAVWFMDGIRLAEPRLLKPANPRGSWNVVAPR